MEIRHGYMKSETYRTIPTVLLNTQVLEIV